jgi:hypothetical protein
MANSFNFGSHAKSPLGDLGVKSVQDCPPGSDLKQSLSVLESLQYPLVLRSGVLLIRQLQVNRVFQLQGVLPLNPPRGTFKTVLV